MSQTLRNIFHICYFLWNTKCLPWNLPCVCLAEWNTNYLDRTLKELQTQFYFKSSLKNIKEWKKKKTTHLFHFLTSLPLPLNGMTSTKKDSNWNVSLGAIEMYHWGQVKWKTIWDYLSPDPWGSLLQAVTGLPPIVSLQMRQELCALGRPHEGKMRGTRMCESWGTCNGQPLNAF
jgi:hypothetical protein